MSTERFLVTGASGCIGAWVLFHLMQDGVACVATDLRPNTDRLALLTEDVSAVDWLALDVTDAAAVDAAVAENGITHIVHLAGLQIPFAKANPPVGSAVNVTGTINIFEAVRHRGVTGLAFASSVAVFGGPTAYPPGVLGDDAAHLPETLYGVFKSANEQTAKLYWNDWQVPSIGLRPAVVYGPGRDQGLTSDLAKAVCAAAIDKPFHIRFDGPAAVQHASDVARIFISAARASTTGANTYNLRGDVMDVAGFREHLLAIVPDAAITIEPDTPLPLPADYDDSGLAAALGGVPHTALDTAIRADIETFRAAVAAGKVDSCQLLA